MANTIRWNTPGSKTTAISSSQNNNLAAGNQTISAAISNDASGELFLYADFMLKLSARTANRCARANVALYLLPDLGDSNYAFGASTTQPPVNAWKGYFYVDSGATTARFNVITGVMLPPENFKVMIENNTGKLFSCCTVVSYRRYNMRSS